MATWRWQWWAVERRGVGGELHRPLSSTDNCRVRACERVPGASRTAPRARCAWATLQPGACVVVVSERALPPAPAANLEFF